MTEDWNGGSRQVSLLTSIDPSGRVSQACAQVILPQGSFQNLSTQRLAAN